jgi:hypothetical protein
MSRAGMTASAVNTSTQPNVLPARVVTLPVDLLRHQLLLTHDPIEDATLTEITDDVFLPLMHARA